LSLFKIPDPRALLSHPFILAIIARLFLRRALLSHPFILAIIARLSLRRAILSPPLILLPRFRIDFPLFLSGPLGAFGTLAALAKFRHLPHLQSFGPPSPERLPAEKLPAEKLLDLRYRTEGGTLSARTEGGTLRHVNFGTNNNKLARAEN
jgi:hypothetical protein